MTETPEQWQEMFSMLESIRNEIRTNRLPTGEEMKLPDFVFMPFRGPEIYLLHKAFIDAGGAPNENYKTLLGKTLSSISNRTCRGFSAASFCKYSDKVDPDAKENVKRFLQRMIRNIESYD